MKAEKFLSSFFLSIIFIASCAVSDSKPLFIVEAARLYEELIHWNAAYIYSYNPAVKLSDGYTTVFTEQRRVSNDAEAITQLAEYCRLLGINFLYVNVPHKTCMYEDKDISGILDYTNQNANRFLMFLEKNNVNYYDLRKVLHDEGMSHHEAFFMTDHHWKPETGLWAAGKISSFMNNNYDWRIDLEAFKPQNFERVIYHDYFLGSEGRKFTLSRVKPEDISILYPRYKTLIEYEVPNLEINATGDFAITYDMKELASRDYYKLNPYAAYNHADQPFIKIKNLLSDSDKKLLIIHESFANCVIPFIALGVKEVDALDLRFFKEGTRDYIRREKPDAVIVMYNSRVIGMLTDNDLTAGAGICDFR